MFIQTEETPNPAVIKFLPGRVVMPEVSHDFPTAEDAKLSPLAERLFQVEGVEGVFFGADFIAVTKSEANAWSLLKPSVLGAIMEHFVTNQSLFYTDNEDNAESTDDDPVVAEIKEIIDARIRPAVAMDGGDIVFDRFENGVVYVKMQGACSGCPSSSVTLKSGIENMLRHYIPEVQEVRAAE